MMDDHPNTNIFFIELVLGFFTKIVDFLVQELCLKIMINTNISYKLSTLPGTNCLERNYMGWKYMSFYVDIFVCMNARMCYGRHMMD